MKRLIVFGMIVCFSGFLGWACDKEGERNTAQEQRLNTVEAELDTLRTLWGYVPYIGLVDSSGETTGLLHLRHFTGATFPTLSFATVLVANMHEGIYYGRIRFDTTATDTTVTLTIYKGRYR